MTAGIVIRSAEESDIPGVRDLLVMTWHDTYDALIGAEKVTEITDNWHSIEVLTRQLGLPDTAFLVAGEEGRIIGHAFAAAPHAPLLFLTRLYVLPSSQRRGLGKRLLDAAIARYPGCNAVRLEAKIGNAEALAFYRREGFRTIEEKIVEGMNHFVMEKRLAPGS